MEEGAVIGEDTHKTTWVLKRSNMPESGETPDRIIKAGRSILLDEGLRSITTNSVAGRARISKKTLYAVFASKDELVEAVLISFIEESLAGLDRIVDCPDPAIVRIRKALAFISEFMPRIQVHVIAKIERFDPGLWARIDAIRTARLKRLAELIPLAQADGHVRGDLDPDVWLLLFLGAVRSVLTPKVLLEGNLSLVQVVNTVEQLFVEGILTPRGHAALSTSPGSASGTGKDLK